MENNPSLPTSRKILGIDPGTNILGYAIIEVISKNAILIHAIGVVKLDKYTGHEQKLKRIFEKVYHLSKTYKPDEMAIEAPFFGKNVQSMLKLGRAQGVAIAAAAVCGLSVCEYSPRKVKQAITGNGNAAKEQVSAMVKHLLKLDALPSYFDATDAGAVAICHYLQTHTGVAALQKNAGDRPAAAPKKKSNNWKNFITDNPDRIK